MEIIDRLIVIDCLFKGCMIGYTTLMYLSPCFAIGLISELPSSVFEINILYRASIYRFMIDWLVVLVAR